MTAGDEKADRRPPGSEVNGTPPAQLDRTAGLNGEYRGVAAGHLDGFGAADRREPVEIEGGPRNERGADGEHGWLGLDKWPGGSSGTGRRTGRSGPSGEAALDDVSAACAWQRDESPRTEDEARVRFHSGSRGVDQSMRGNEEPVDQDGPELSDPLAASSMRERVVSFAGLAAAILGRPPRLGTCRAVAVDGPSGSGKSTFAARLGRALQRQGVHVEIVHTDELLDGWDDQLTFWPRLESGLLEPIRRGRSGTHPVYDWTAGRFRGVRHVARPDVLIVEGVSSAREEFRSELTYSVFLDADRELRFGRALARDGTQIAGPLRRWMAAETRYFSASATADRVDEQVDGSPRVRHDPESEYVRLR